jgi:hypothetical protein
MLLVCSASIVRAVRADTGESISGKLAAWARDNHLGRVVDIAETLRYSDPPSRSAATELELEDVVQPPSPPPMDVTTPRADPSPAWSGTPATTSPPVSPSALNPVIAPSLPSEGAWRVIRSVDGVPAVWTTGLRPSVEFGSVQASFAVINQSLLRAALFNGTEIPGKKPSSPTNWLRQERVPANLAEHLVFAFNGGFRREHARGGYLTEGVEVWKMQNDRATLAIDVTGRVHVGTWGVSLNPAGHANAPWASARQNLTLIVRNGAVASDITSIQWGSSSKGALFILRSAVCERQDGLLMYAIIGAADALITARTLVAAGCRNAIQLDVNASYPRAYSFIDAVPQRLDQRMAGRDDIYLTGSYREFIAFFEHAPTASASEFVP